MTFFRQSVKICFLVFMGKWIDQGFFIIVGKFKRAIGIMAFIGAYIVSLNIPHGGWIIRETTTPFIGIILLWDLCQMVSRAISPQCQEWLNKISKYSFGLYLYDEPINYLVLWIASDIIGVWIFGSEVGAVAIFLSHVVVSTIFAFFAVWILEKVNLKIKLY